MPMIIKKTMINKTMCIVQELHTLLKPFKVHYSHQCFHYILQLVYQIIFYLHLQFL